MSILKRDTYINSTDPLWLSAGALGTFNMIETPITQAPANTINDNALETISTTTTIPARYKPGSIVSFNCGAMLFGGITHGPGGNQGEIQITTRISCDGFIYYSTTNYFYDGKTNGQVGLMPLVFRVGTTNQPLSFDILNRIGGTLSYTQINWDGAFFTKIGDGDSEVLPP